jgi:hypothetical protein
MFYPRLNGDSSSPFQNSSSDCRPCCPKGKCQQLFLGFLESVSVADEALGVQPAQPERLPPKWDHMLRTLSVDGVVVAQFGQHPAYNQVAVLAHFEQAGWPVGIASPFRKRELNQTLKDLNRKIRPKLIKFRGNGTGEGVLWERVLRPGGTDRC